MTDNKRIDISIEYLVDLLSSIKSALGNLDSNGDTLQTLISDLSENFTVLSELSKRQYQDSKEMNEHLAKIEANIQDIVLSNQMMHQDLASRVDRAVDMINSLNELKNDIHYVADRFKLQDLTKRAAANAEKNNKDNVFVKWSGNLQTFFTNMDIVGKAILGILLTLAMLVSIFKFSGGSFSDIGTMAHNILSAHQGK